MNRKETAILAGVLMSALVVGSAYANDGAAAPAAEGAPAKKAKNSCKGHGKKVKGAKEGCGANGCSGHKHEDKNEEKHEDKKAE